MLFAARDECLEWQSNWKSDNKDPDQLDIGFED